MIRAFIFNGRYPSKCLETSVALLNSLNIHLCLHGSMRMMPFASKHNVQESSRTLSFRNCSRKICRGKTILSCACSCAWPLKLSNCRPSGGNRNGSEPKLKRHCWKDMNEAAAKNPSLQQKSFKSCGCLYHWNSYFALPNTCFKTPPSTPFMLNTTSCASKSSRQPRTEPPDHTGKL